MEIKFRRRFEAAHRFYSEGARKTLCGYPHGHTWFVTVSLTYNPPKKLDHSTNILLPFKFAKEKWHQWIDHHVDHAFMYNSEDPLLKFMVQDNPQGRHLVAIGDPTTEFISVAFMSKFQCFLKEVDPALICTQILIDETQTNAVTFSGNPQDHLPSGDHWWTRPDFSTHDLKI